jgi:serine/threonine-protein kinase
LDREHKHPSGRARSAIGHRFGTLQLRELLAVRGEAGLWLAEDDDGDRTLLRLYPGLPTLEEWHTLELAGSQLIYAINPRLVPVKEIALDVWPHLIFDCSGAESLAQLIAREPMSPAAAVAMCADVSAALAALGRIGVPPVDISPADIVLGSEQARLLPDVGLPGGKLAHACVDLDHIAPERAAAIADRARGVRAEHPGDGHPTAESMAYALASIVSAAIRGPQPAVGTAPTALPARLEQTLRRGLAQSPSERYGTPAALVEALCDAIGVPLRRRSARPRAARARGTGTAAVARPTRPGRRTISVALPVAVLLAAAAIGTVAGSATTAPDPPAAVTLASAGLSVQAPQGWLRGGPGEAPPTLGDPALVAHPPGHSTATALIVTREAAPMLAQLSGTAPEPVRLGDNDAWRYRDVAVDAEGVADVYVLADGADTIVAACLGPSDAPASVRAGCSAALTTLRLPAGRATALGGDAAARRELTQVVGDLDRTRASERRALTTAATGRRQAAAADRLAAAYARAADGAGRAGTVGTPGELPRLVDQLEETGHAYTALATAARATHRTAYAQARERVAAHEQALQKDLAALASTSSS